MTIPMTPSEDEEAREDAEWAQIIHNPCGLPVELCECPNAEIKYVGDYPKEDGKAGEG